MPLPLEVAVFSVQDGITAQSLGAQRIEYNAPGSYPEGGLTPPLRDLQALSAQVTIPVRVMIRPRGPPPDQEEPDFIYSDEDLKVMIQAINDFKAAAVIHPIRGDGFVFGILRQSDGSNGNAVEIDEERCKQLVQIASPVPCVFHRAFDSIATTSSWSVGLDTLVRCGFQGLLTAGGTRGRYYDNIDRLDELCRHAAGRIEIVAGGGVRHHNVASSAVRLARFGFQDVWVHSAALQKDSNGVDTEELSKLLLQLAKRDGTM